MTDRQNKMLEEMKRGIKEALEICEAVEDIEAPYNTAQEIKSHYIGKLYQLAFIATIETFYEKSG